MKEIKNLKPSAVWKYFLEICEIPRPSKKEEKILQYLLDFGKKNNLETKQDNTGNILISKPATPGFEKSKTVTLQCHVDMVCEKNQDVNHDFEKDPIIPYIEGEWIKAKGTTLGADNGIGIALQLAILEDTNVKHGPLECLFTVDEETGLTGAFNLEANFFSAPILINLDSEDEGELFIGCAGGIDTLVDLLYKKKKPKPQSLAYKISVGGLKGGHSGDDIEKGLGNANKILNRLLWNAAKDYKLRLSDFNGGNLRNAIPREASAIITIPAAHKKVFESICELFELTTKEELFLTDPGIKITVDPIPLPDFIIDKKSQQRLLNSIYACPHGIYAMSHEMEDLVETSTNLASVKFVNNNIIQVTTSQRSSVDSSLKDIASMVRNVFRLAGAKVTHTGGYPGWKPNTNSQILGIIEQSYRKLFKTEAKVKAIHAGLECGLFLEKYPDLDMISIGPTIKWAHSPDEMLHIESTLKTWDLLLDVLENIPTHV